MQRFRNQAQKVPECIGILHVSLRVTLLGVDEVGKLQGVADEEDRRVVSHHVPVTFLGVKLESEPTRIPGSIRKPTLTSHGGKSSKHGRLLTHFIKEFRLAKISHVAGDKTVTNNSSASLVSSKQPPLLCQSTIRLTGFSMDLTD